MSPDPASTSRHSRDGAPAVESFLWLAAGAAWAFVAIKAWSESKKVEARRRTRAVSNRLLAEVFPNGIRP